MRQKCLDVLEKKYLNVIMELHLQARATTRRIKLSINVWYYQNISLYKKIPWVLNKKWNYESEIFTQLVMDWSLKIYFTVISIKI